MEPSARPEMQSEHPNSDRVRGWIELTSTCPMQCGYCYAGAGYEKRDEFPLALVIRLLDEFNQLNAEWVMLSGGEPCLRQDLAEILAETMRRGFRTQLITSASLLPDSVLQVLKEHKVPVQVTLDSVDPAVFFLSRGRPNLPIILYNIDRMLEAGIDLNIAVTLTSVTEKTIRQTIEWTVAKGIHNMHFSPVIPEGRGKWNQSLVPQHLTKDWLLLYQLQKEYCDTLSIDLVEDLVTSTVFPGSSSASFCNAMSGRNLEISADGTVYSCGGMRDNPEVYLGNVYSESLVTIHRRTREAGHCLVCTTDHIAECLGCPELHICKGHCRATAYYASGSVTARSPFCYAIKQVIGQILCDLESGAIDDYITRLHLEQAVTGLARKKWM